MANLSSLGRAFNSVGWFIPPYMALGGLAKIAAEIETSTGPFEQPDLEFLLGYLYSPENLAAMATERYPVAPIIQDYQQTILEAIKAHCLGLSHIAIGGLVPVIEGAGRRLARQRGIKADAIKSVFIELADNCSREAKDCRLGDPDEVECMMNSFKHFTTNALYSNSSSYPFSDRTNRHGIAHGAYADADYGSPLNFFKTIAAVDFLTFSASMGEGISWFAPSPTIRSRRLADFLIYLRSLASAQARTTA